ncbi:MAG: carboxylesterase family protein [Ketobacter sp.]|nr:MAG: carboxylesterase family protein [Ketobacter sp.]
MMNGFLRRKPYHVLTIALLTIVSALFSGCKYKGNIQTETSYGTLLGNRDDQVTRFLGIPFAAPPVGELRWADPQPPAHWEGVRDATWFGHACNQTVPLLPVRSPGREDCLTLNVWAPNTPGPHPVMFWIHGGAGMIGSANEIQYDGAKLAAAQNVVVVSANYRLWGWGLLALPELGSRPRIKGNQAIKDLIMALQWVQGDIHHFGGDPDNVTVFGESAGAYNTCALLATPKTLEPRLFHKAILQSGVCDTLAIRTRAESEAEGLRMIEKMGCMEADEPLDCARSKTAARIRGTTPTNIIKALNMSFSEWPFGLTIDGDLFPKHPLQLLAELERPDTPILLGTNKDEGSLFTALMVHPRAEYYEEVLARRYPDASERLLELYPVENYVSTGAAQAQIRSDIIMNCPSLQMARIYSRQNPVWLYHFTYDVKSVFQPLARTLLGRNSAPMGTFHATDLGFVFDTPLLTSVNRETDLMVKHFFQQAWGNFARTGNPNDGLLPPWENFDPTRDNYLSLNEDPSNLEGFRAGYCDYWLDPSTP